jgi:hypothetical protein
MLHWPVDPYKENGDTVGRGSGRRRTSPPVLILLTASRRSRQQRAIKDPSGADL